MIIGIAGTLGAGKGTVVERLKVKGFTHYSVSGRLVEILRERELPEDRPHMSTLADELAIAHRGGILEVMYQKAQADGVTDFILESIHRESEADYVRSIGGIILAVDVDPHVRYERSQLRQEGEKDNVTYEEFLAAIEREEKGNGDGMPNINAVIKTADHHLMNNDTIEVLHAKVDQWLQTLQ